MNGRIDIQLELAIQRNLLANERTFSAWFRTGLTSIGAGLGVAGLLEDVASPGLILAIAFILVANGSIMAALAWWRYKKTCRELLGNLSTRVTPAWLLGVFTAAMIAVAILALIIVLEMRQ